MSTVSTVQPLDCRDLVTGTELSASELQMLLATATALKHDYSAFHGCFSGKAIALLFEKPSLRTRMTFEIGFSKLGGHAAYVDQQSAQIGKRESLKDSVMNLERWVDVIVARTFSHQTIEQIAQFVNVPVVNALSDRFHPCQALADVLTIAEEFPDRSWSEIRLAYIGDGNNVSHSLLIAAATLGMHMSVITPAKYEPAADIVVQAKSLAKHSGARLTISTDTAAAAGHDVIYTDTWVSMGSESEAESRLTVFAPYQITPRIMQNAGNGAVFMHCLPAYRGKEVAAEVIDGPQSVVYDQAENRMHAQNALLMHLLARRPASPSTTASWPDAVGAVL